ncbi:hypothetical protein Tco_0231356 [Tanacetum coccineum]
MRQGWDPRYKIWVEHGEPTPPTPPPVIDNTRQPPMSDMTALLNDLSYIPPNNEHNEPTQGDIGETSNEPTQATRNEFEELYASANEELYPGHLEHFVNGNDNLKTRQGKTDLQMLGIRSGLWLGQTKNGKCLKPQAAYSFTPENRKKFCQYIKGVKPPPPPPLTTEPTTTHTSTRAQYRHHLLLL